ncbi:hypothetical protein PGTUg99_037051 [Puccinia graminis f. sp. tritici]|uniref:Uncharacterized protein n=1 Tax=Puccinia graminis f. sp. tritici TaxID=56615 RepID=A0A5B0PQB4_PUCGR|nr:hypothetical protein PGTUg99_037051 [Puccinia graminis f. sp. tritici]
MLKMVHQVYQFYIILARIGATCAAFNNLIHDPFAQLLEDRAQHDVLGDVEHFTTGLLDHQKDAAQHLSSSSGPRSFSHPSVPSPEFNFQTTWPTFPEADEKFWPWLNEFDQLLPSMNIFPKPPEYSTQDTRYPSNYDRQISNTESHGQIRGLFREGASQSIRHHENPTEKFQGSAKKPQLPSQEVQRPSKKSWASRLESEKESKKRKLGDFDDPNKLNKNPGLQIKTTDDRATRDIFPTWNFDWDAFFDSKDPARGLEEHPSRESQDYSSAVSSLPSNSNNPSIENNPFKTLTDSSVVVIEDPHKSNGRSQNQIESQFSGGKPAKFGKQSDQSIVKSQNLIYQSPKFDERTKEEFEISRRAAIKFSQKSEKRKLFNFEDPEWRKEMTKKIMNEVPVSGQNDQLPRLSFDRNAFFLESQSGKSTIQLHALSPMFRTMKIHEGQKMSIPEAEVTLFLRRSYNPRYYKDDEYQAWKEKVQIFLQHQELWAKYWNQLKMESCFKEIGHKKLKEIFPLYLFYISMINSIIPRAVGQELSEEDELKSAALTFINYAQGIEKYVNNRHTAQIKWTLMEEKRLDYFQRILREDTKGSRVRINLWAFLDVWMENNRPLLFSTNQTLTGMFTQKGRKFFNQIFISSIENLIKYYEKLNAESLLKTR